MYRKVMKQKYFYVYYSYEQSGRGYIGKRQSSCHPSEDIKYFGSFSDKTFSPTHKWIIAIFETEEKALEAEIVLHNFFEVHVNPHFANRAKQTSKYFTSHVEWSEERKEQLSERNRQYEWTEKTRNKISKSLTGRIWITNGKENKQLLSVDDPIPDGWNRGLTKRITNESRQKMSEWQKGKPKWNEEQRKKIGEKVKGTKWWNDGKTQVQAKESPGNGWKLGTLNAGVKRGPLNEPLKITDQDRERRRQQMIELNKSRTKKV